MESFQLNPEDYENTDKYVGTTAFDLVGSDENAKELSMRNLAKHYNYNYDDFIDKHRFNETVKLMGLMLAEQYEQLFRDQAK